MENRESYFSKIPIWNADEPKFEVLNDEISGRIPVAKIEHWKDIIDILESDYFNRSDIQWVFRGHRRYDWSLIPTLGRLSPSGIATDDLAKRQINLFRQTIRGRVNDHSLLLQDNQIEELWSIGQHHGLSTPLLDWTYSPYVALFFAFHQEDSVEEEDNPYRSIYILNKTFVDSNESFEEVRIFEPRKDDHGRLVSQAGLFIFTPTDSTLENKMANILSEPDFPDEELINADEDNEANVLAKYICKIYIKNEDHTNCLKHLRRMNVHHASLFPDIIGAADYCNILVAEQVLEEQLKVNQDFKEAAEVVGDDKVGLVKKSLSNEELIDSKEVHSIEKLLNTPESSKEVESARLSLIAKQLDKLIRENAVVDWETREAIHARIRNGARVILRKYAYPLDARDSVISQIIDVIASKSNNTLEFKEGDLVNVKDNAGDFIFIEYVEEERYNGEIILAQKGDAMLRNKLNGATRYFPVSQLIVN